MSIGDAAARAGLPAKTIRYYESIGLIPKPARSRAGYRDYGPADVRLLRFVRRARALGFSVEQCRALLDLYRDDERPSAAVRALAQQHAREIADEIRALQEMQASLERLVAACCGDERPECPILDELAERTEPRGARREERSGSGVTAAIDAAEEKVMEDTQTIAERYFNAFYGGDHATARQCLADDLSFAGPAATFQSADAFIKASAHVARGVKTAQPRRIFVDGADVCILHEIVLAHGTEPHFVAEWYRLRGDKIAAIRLVLDTASLMPRRPARAEETAVDPVCQMTVAKDAAAATRTHAGATYYFCHAGCAAAFEREPERYLQAPQG